MIFSIFGHHQEDQDAKKCQKTGNFWGFWDNLWSFCHCNSTYDTFLEFMDPWELPGFVSRIVGDHFEDKDGKKYPKIGIWGILGV